MVEKDKFAEREHWLEEEYFGRKNQELIENLRERRAHEADRQRMAKIIGVDDQEALEALQELGYTADTIPLLRLVPLVEVAWGEGGVADRERDLIFRIAEDHGVRPDSVAYDVLSNWMENKPSERFFENSMLAIRLILNHMPEERRKTERRELIDDCDRIGSAVSSGIFGPGGPTMEERGLIRRIATEIDL